MAEGAGSRKRAFDPVVDANTRLLILGSLPGDASLKAAQYYAHPRNGFWPLIGGVLDEPLTALSYSNRLDRLRARGVGLWDVIASAERIGSLDINIRNHRSNALAEFAATLPNLRAIAFNGGKASSLGRRQLGPEPGYTLINLPSSSPAHAAVPFERKRMEWRALAGFVSTDA